MVRPFRRPGEHELSEGMRLLDRYSILESDRQRRHGHDLPCDGRSARSRRLREAAPHDARRGLRHRRAEPRRLPGDVHALPPGSARALEAAASEHAPHLRLRLPRRTSRRAGRAVPRLRVPRRRQPRDARPPARPAPADGGARHPRGHQRRASPRRTSTASSIATSSRRTSSSRGSAASSSRSSPTSASRTAT